ncbi:MAG TPA: HDOD domain-containing protein [Myxococcota bacterium]|nr:HDOD domain-containing protein [Myxococcota bacterium]
MAAGLDDLDAEGLGAISSDRFTEAARRGGLALVETDPAQERWVTPLLRAIQRKRLRLPSLSPTVHRVIRLIESAEVDLDELAEAVGGDPALATRIMGVANSSYFRGATSVPNVREALMRMGVREARTIVVVVALRSTVLRSPGLGASASAIWKHSLLTATATQEITRELPSWESSGFLAGLVHDLGQLVVLAFVSELPAWQEDGEAPDPETVAALSDATHAALGALVLASWGFPEDFCEAILGHHEPATVEGRAGELARAVSLAQGIASQIEQGWPGDPAELDAALAEAGESLGLDRDRLTDIANEAESSFAALEKLG